MREVFPSIRFVRQERSADCGIAAVAMLAGRSYRDVEKKYREVFPNETSFRTSPADARKLLKGLDAPSRLGRKVPCSDWEQLKKRVKKTALVAINLNKDGDEWHWVVYVSCPQPFVLDPRSRREGGRRTDWGRMRLAWYHPVGGTPNSNLGISNPCVNLSGSQARADRGDWGDQGGVRVG